MGVEAGGQGATSVGEQTSDAEVWARVRSALENPKYKFGRTVKGLAKESGLDQEQVEGLLVRHHSDVVRREGKGGRSHYALRERVDENRRRHAKQRTGTPGAGSPISDADARTRVRKLLRKAQRDPRFPQGCRSLDAILKSTKLRRDLDPERRRQYVEELLAGQSDIDRFERREDGEILF
ncbi:MAG: hypothetical protein J4G16_06910, partial [Acidobacteria bacterium]|nr:hypothetical protein [Acidobacteriota bacterium]